MPLAVFEFLQRESSRVFGVLSIDRQSEPDAFGLVHFAERQELRGSAFVFAIDFPPAVRFPIADDLARLDPGANRDLASRF